MIFVFSFSFPSFVYVFGPSGRLRCSCQLLCTR